MTHEKMLSICLVEDDAVVAKLVETVLTEEGHRVRAFTDPAEALKAIPVIAPDVVLSDIMMNGMDGIELCRRLRERPGLADLKVVMLSAKAYPFDMEQAKKAGAAGFITKPIQPATLYTQILAAIRDFVTIRYWGVRGTLPVPGRKSLIYGGNTICLSMEFPQQRNFVFDAGTGIKELSNYVQARHGGKWSARVFISHPHWDHINAIPYFVPMFVPGNEFEVIGARHGDRSMRELISAQMDDVYFPVTLKEMGARVYFRDIEPGTLTVDGIEVRCMYLSHPGKCLGYRVNYGAASFCYITDNEIYPQGSAHHNPHFEAQLVDFMRGADIAIMDACYTEAEYRKKANWGHSSVNEVVRIAHAAEVAELQLFHHDPDQDDRMIEAKLETATALLAGLKSKTRCTVPREGDGITLR